MIPQAQGEGPARLAKGIGRETIALARAWKPHTRIDPRKLARQYRAQADGFDRRAGFLRDDGDMAGAHVALAESARLRRLADDAEADKFSKIIA